MATIAVTRLCRRAPTVIKLCSRSTSNITNVHSTWIFNASRSITHNASLVIRRINPATFNLVRRYADEKKSEENVKKLSLFQKFKQMYRDYWYVLVPVHIVTSIAWFGGFYYLAESGIDIVAILESWHVSDKIISPLRDSSMGYLAVAYALYKIATPLRYMVTLGGTTFSINYLKNLGYIKPVPSAQQLKVMYARRKNNLMGSVRRKQHDKVKKDYMVGGLEKKIKVKMVKDKSKSTKHKREEGIGDIEKDVKPKE